MIKAMLKQFRIFLIVIFHILPINSYGFVVLIDPGHGGSEYGATTKVSRQNSNGKWYSDNLYEKDLTLKLAKELKKRLQKKFSTYLTRSIDRTVSLEERAELADTVKADVFISIHFNSSAVKRSHGIETYYLDNHDDKAIKKVEAIENVSLKGDSKVINQILIDLVIQKTVPSSKKLAMLIHEEVSQKISKKMSIRDRGIKPGLFYVLALSKRPGVLIEAGFVSNPKEAQRISSHQYIEEYAKSIAQGIINYQAQLPKKDLPLF